MKKHLGLFIFDLLVFAFSITLIFLPVRTAIITFIETECLHRTIEEFRYLQFFLGIAYSGFLFIIVSLFSITVPGKAFFSKAAAEMKKTVQSLCDKRMLKYAAGTVLILFFCYYPIFRSDYYASIIDDLRRSLSGETNYTGFCRYITEIGSILMHTNIKLADIAPLSQAFAVVFLAFTVLILAYLFNGKSVSVMAVIAASPAALSPWFLTNMSYRYDSPFMALSVLASVVPLLFADSAYAFGIVSVVSTWIVCMTYQASSGIYVVAVLFYAYYLWIKRNQTGPDCWKFILTAACCYLFAYGFFKIAFVPADPANYVNPSVFTPGTLLSGITGNAVKYISYLWNDLGRGLIKYLFLIVFLIFLTVAFFYSRKNNVNAVLAVILACAVSVFCLFVSYGVYMVMMKPLWDPRAFTGTGIVMAVLPLMIVTLCRTAGTKQKIVPYAAVSLFCYSLVAYLFIYANCATSQKKYAEFRAQALLSDLNDYCPVPEQAKMDISGSCGWAPETRISFSIYPLIRRSIDMNLENPYTELIFLKQYGYGNYSGYKLSKMGHAPEYTKDMDLPLLKDTGLHTIYGDGEYFRIILKPAKRVK